METVNGPLTPDQLRTLLANPEAASSDSACPDDDQLEAYVTGSLQAGEHGTIEAHLETCESCREEVEEWRREWRSLFNENGEPNQELEAFQDRVRHALYRVSDEGSDPAAQSASQQKRPATTTMQMVQASEPTAGLRSWFSVWMAWLKGPALVPAMAIGLMAFVGLSVYQAGRLAERDSAPQRQVIELEAGTQVRAAMLETIRALSEWRVAVENGADTRAVAASMRRVDLVELPRAAGAPFPLLAVSRVGGEISALGASLDRDQTLRAEYDDYLRRLSDTLPPLADVLVQTGKVEHARILFAFLRREHPEIAGNWYGEAEMCKLDQDHRAAIALYEEMIQRGVVRSDPRPYHYAGYSSFLLGHFSEALEYYDKALAIAPGYAKVYYNKALLYRQMPGLTPGERERLYEENWQRALDLTQRAYAAAGEANPRITFTLAILHAVRENDSNRDRALIFLERAIQGERTYLTRAQAEPAFSFFRDPRNEQYYSRFQDLLDRYRSRSSQSGALQGPYDPDIFIE